MSDTRIRGMDEVPRYRARLISTMACEWERHFWCRFINVALGNGETLLMLCENCGMTPLEAMDTLTMRITK